MYDIILKKREGGVLTAEEINFAIQGYTRGEIPDYQMAALLMAVYFRGMDARETADLTLAMVESGSRVDLSGIEGIKVDKHSTGGVADTTTLILAPLVAAAGVPVAKMSGRGLGHTGGTLDKLEAIPGFKVGLSKEQFIANVNRIKLAVVGQSQDLVPADGKIYALRDVTATVDSIPLIASSIMSKKIAAGADAIVLDVKTGSGAFMKTLEGAFALARAMVEIGSKVGRRTVALVTDMDQPLGMAVGNALEVKEAIETLRSGGASPLCELCLTLGAHMLILGGAAATVEEGRRILAGILASGKALVKFKEMIEAQGGDPAVVDDLTLLPQAAHRIPVKAPSTGYIQAMQARTIGRSAMLLGAGRVTKTSSIDLAVGFQLQKRVGDYIEAGDVLAVMHANDLTRAEEALQTLLSAYTIGAEPVNPPPLIYGTVTDDGIN